MDIVPYPDMPPGQCIASLRSDDPEGFIDTRLTPSLDGDHRIYVSVGWVKEMAGKLGMRSREEYEALEREVELLEQRVFEVEDELAQVDAVVDAIDVIESRDFRARRKPGRKPRRTDDELEAA